MNDISRTNSIPWEGSYPLQRSQFWPIYFHTAVYQEILELAYLLFFFSEFFGKELVFQAVVGQQACGFSDVPFHGVEAIATVGDVGG